MLTCNIAVSSEYCLHACGSKFVSRSNRKVPVAGSVFVG